MRFFNKRYVPEDYRLHDYYRPEDRRIPDDYDQETDDYMKAKALAFVFGLTYCERLNMPFWVVWGETAYYSGCLLD